MPRPKVPKCFSQANSLCASVVKSTFSMKTFIKGPTLSNVGSTLQFSMEVSTFEFSIESDDDDPRFGGFVRDNSSDNLSTTKSLKWNVMTLIRRGQNFSFFAALYCTYLDLNALFALQRKEGGLFCSTLLHLP